MSSNPNDLSYLVSSIDLKNKIRHKIKIVQYKQLFKCDDLLKLLPNKLSILVILINTSPNNSGHWTLLVRQDKLLTYFDSYGKAIDQELKYVSDAYRKELHETKPYLTILVNNAIKQGYQLECNKIDFQSRDNDIATCGKWVTFVANSLLNGLNLQETQNLIKQLKSKNNKSFDEIVSWYYNNHF